MFRSWQGLSGVLRWYKHIEVQVPLSKTKKFAVVHHTSQKCSTRIYTYLCSFTIDISHLGAGCTAFLTKPDRHVSNTNSLLCPRNFPLLDQIAHCVSQDLAHEMLIFRNYSLQPSHPLWCPVIHWSPPGMPKADRMSTTVALTLKLNISFQVEQRQEAKARTIST